MNSLAESQKAVESHGCKPWATNLTIIPHTLGTCTVFPRIELAASIFSHRLEQRLLIEGGFYSREASINASKLPITIIFNTSNLFHTASLTCRHVDLLILCSYVRHHDSVTGIVFNSGFRSLRCCIQITTVC